MTSSYKYLLTPQQDGGELERESAYSSRFRPDVPHPARVYNYWLGGKDHFHADRQVGRTVQRLCPQIVDSAHANRTFLARAVRYLTIECGIRQFLDIGTGLPAPDNTHEIAQRHVPECRIVYLDNDPVVLAYARALLTSAPQGVCDYIDADLRDTAVILADAERTLDLTQPVAVLLLAVLQLIPDADDPPGIVARLAAALAPGSYIAISHMTADFAPGRVAAAVEAYNAAAPVPLIARTRTQVTELFGGLKLLPPELVPVTAWRPDPVGARRSQADLYGGIARIMSGCY